MPWNNGGPGPGDKSSGSGDDNKRPQGGPWGNVGGNPGGNAGGNQGGQSGGDRPEPDRGPRKPNNPFGGGPFGGGGGPLLAVAVADRSAAAKAPTSTK